MSHFFKVGDKVRTNPVYFTEPRTGIVVAEERITGNLFPIGVKWDNETEKEPYNFYKDAELLLKMTRPRRSADHLPRRASPEAPTTVALDALTRAKVAMALARHNDGLSAAGKPALSFAHFVRLLLASHAGTLPAEPETVAA